MNSRDKAENLIPAASVCAPLGISQMTLWRWLRDPALDFPRPIYIRRRRYWREADIQAWIESRAPKAA